MVGVDSKPVQWFIIIILWWLIFWGASWEFAPSMDMMTYGALAKNILKTGDWTTLHYSQQAYSNFYQHPPLGIWIFASSFAVLGASDITMKVVPTLMALLTLVMIFFWGKRIPSLSSNWTGFVAAFVLLTSTRFVKYSQGMILDVPLTLFMVASIGCGGMVFADHNSKKYSPLFALMVGALSGIFFSAALLSKGLPALAVPAVFVALVAMTVLQRRWDRIKSDLGFLLGFTALTLVCVGAWLFFANGFEYFAEYWKQSVQGRLSGDSISGHFGAIRKLLEIYWPWLPFYLFGLYRILKSRQNWLSPQGLAALVSLTVLAGFTYSGHFLEQYLVPFFPFAAVVVSSVISNFTFHFRENVTKFLLVIIFGYSIFLASIPISVHGDTHQEPLRLLLKKVASQCRSPQLTQVIIADNIASLWGGMAKGLWYTPLDTRVESIKPSITLSDHQILIASDSFTSTSELTQYPGLKIKNLVAYGKKGLNHCNE